MFAVGVMVGWKDNDNFWVAFHYIDLVDDESLLWKVPPQQAEQTQLLKLSSKVRKVAIFHQLREQCHVNTTTKDVRHNQYVIEGGVHRFFRRH